LADDPEVRHRFWYIKDEQRSRQTDADRRTTTDDRQTQTDERRQTTDVEETKDRRTEEQT
jgi:hypothetical protein